MAANDQEIPEVPPERPELPACDCLNEEAQNRKTKAAKHDRLRKIRKT